MSAQHLNAFCVSLNEEYIYAGDKRGQIHILETDSLEPVNVVNAHFGIIQSMVSHPTKPIIAMLGKDRQVSVWDVSNPRKLELIFKHNIRDYPNEGVDPMHFESQAISLHPEKDILATTSSKASLLELDYSNPNDIQVKTCAQIASDIHKEFCIAVVRYHDDKVICGEMRTGQISLVKDGEVIEQIIMPECKETVHWFEPVGDGSYLVACDARRILQYFPEDPSRNRGGDTFTRDDCEYVAIDKQNKRIYVSSFDRTVYEIDFNTLLPLREVYRADFKVRWLYVLERNPSQMIVQVRNGSLVKIDIETGKELNLRKETSDTLWSIAQSKKDVFVCGEGDYVFNAKSMRLIVDDIPHFDWHKVSIDTDSRSYTKRATIRHSTGDCFFARTNGKIFKLADSKIEQVVQFNTAVRDICPSEQFPILYAGLEDRRVLAINTDTFQIVGERAFDQPIWSIAYNEDREVIACGERNGQVHLIDALTFETIYNFRCNYPKRMKWINGNNLFVSCISWIDKITFDGDDWRRQEKFFEQHGNTLEDFDWNIDRTYIATIAYNNMINIYDFKSGLHLDSTYNGIDYMKGVAFLKTNKCVANYAADFMVVGRSGYPQLFRIHDEQIHSLGNSFPSSDMYQDSK